MKKLCKECRINLCMRVINSQYFEEFLWHFYLLVLMFTLFINKIQGVSYKIRKLLDVPSVKPNVLATRKYFSSNGTVGFSYCSIFQNDAIFILADSYNFS